MSEQSRLGGTHTALIKPPSIRAPIVVFRFSPAAAAMALGESASDDIVTCRTERYGESGSVAKESPEFKYDTF